MTDPAMLPLGSWHWFAWGDVERTFVHVRGGWDDGARVWDAVDMSEHGWRYLKSAT